MWRILVAVAALGALSAATAVQQVSDHQPARGSSAAAHRAAAADDGGPAIALRRVAAIAADEARTLRREARRCERLRRSEARTRCEQMVLAHAAAGAKLNAVILHAAGPRAGRACVQMAARLAGLVTTLAYVAVDGTRSLPWPSQVRADARAAARVAARIRGAASPAACLPGADGPRA